MFYRRRNVPIAPLVITLAIWGGLTATQATAAAGVAGDRYSSVLARDASPASLSIVGPRVRESGSGTVPATFTVSLSQAVGYEAWFTYRTRDRSATSGGQAPDYVAASGKGSVPAGQTSAEVVVSVLDDTADEPTETFVLELVNADVPIANSLGVCTIEDDDGTPTLLKPVGDAAATCRAGEMKDLTVELSDENERPLPGITVNWTVTEGDASFPPDVAMKQSSTTGTDGTTGVSITCPSAGQSQIVARVDPNQIAARVEGLETQFTLTVGDYVPDLTILDPVAASVGEALNTICLRDDLSADLRAICQAVAKLPASELNGALRQLATEEASAQITAAAEAARIQLRNLGARLADLHAAVVTAGRGNDGAGFFLYGTLGRGDRPATVPESGFDLETRGITAGIDFQLLPPTPKGNRFLFVGGAIGFYSTNAGLVGGAGGLETQGASMSAYATYLNNSRRYHLDGIVTYGRGELDFERRINFPCLVPQVARAAPDSDQLALSLGGGRIWERGPLTVRGLGRVDYLQATIDGYAEQGAPGFNLVLAEQELRSLLANAGVQISYQKHLSGQRTIEPMIRLDAVHEFEDNSRPIKARFLDDPGHTPFIVATDEPDRDFFNLRLGLSVQLRPWQRAYLFYTEDLERQDLSFNSVSLGARFEF